ncbi:MAG: chemotaxis protein CheW [Helicobacteraceae bacterium]|jgi:purine-binding chemotaxis protein CheW|nr:chemotaxis protein CheW [Helicobacteraceae bacterium]
MKMTNAEHSGKTYERFLTFYLGAECYGVPIASVKEIIALIKTTKIPKSPYYLRGVMNLRGVIIPVVDMRARFHMEAVEATMHTAVIIVKIREDSIGFVVDRVEEVVNASNDQISEPTSFGDGVDRGYIKNMIRTEKAVIMVMGLENILSEQELAELEHSAQNAGNNITVVQ